MLENNIEPDLVNEPKQLWRRFTTRSLNGIDANENPLKIGIAGSFTTDPLVPYLGGQLLRRGLTNPTLTVGPYNQIYQLCFDPQTLLGDVDIIVILWRLEDLLKDNFDAVQSEIDRLLDAIQTLRKKFDGMLIVATPPYPQIPAFDVHDLQQPSSGSIFYSSIVQRWTDGLNQVGGIQLLGLDTLLSQSGYEASQDIRKWYLYKQPYTEAFWARTGNQIARIIAAQSISAKKCIVLDCDNTLWGGIVGEDGVAGIEIGEDFPGSAFTDFQRYLLHLRSRGIFLAIASKNNAEDVDKVFEKHDAMVLQREHISVFQVHWNSKVESLQAIANILNIGVDSLVFIDDSPKEIDEVKQRLPEVSCFLVPEDTAYLPGLLRNSGLFDLSDVTEDDRNRADRMLVESERQLSSENLSEQEFLSSLELEVTVFEAEPTHIARIEQLINKTNQFNLTTIRRTQDEVKALSASPDARVFAIEVADRFGEYGLVGVAIVSPATHSEWNLDTLLMSCRVLGRGVETAMIARIADAARQCGCSALRGHYLATKKNRLVKDLFMDHSFSPDGDDWIIDVDAVKKPPDYVSSTLRLAD